MCWRGSSRRSRRRALADIDARTALADMSAQLAPIAQAPRLVIRRLAGNDEIRIAAPVLQESARLGDDDLVAIAKTKSEQHLLAISGRWWLKSRSLPTRCWLAAMHASAAASSAIPAHGCRPTVLRSSWRRRNTTPSSRSRPASASICPRSCGDNCSVRRRKPSGQNCCQRAPPHLFEEIRQRHYGKRRECLSPRNVAGARLHRRAAFCCGAEGQGRTQRGQCCSAFARQKKYEETVAGAGGAVAVDDRRRPPPDAEPARRRPSGCLQGRPGSIWENDGGGPGMPLFNRRAGRGRTGAGKASLRGNDGRQRPAHAVSFWQVRASTSPAQAIIE